MLCSCDTCGLREVRVFVRKMAKREVALKKYVILQEDDGSYSAREWFADGTIRPVPVTMLDACGG